MSRLYRITSGSHAHFEAAGMEFEVDDDATEEEIAEAAAELVMEHISFGWEEVEAKKTEVPSE